MAQRGNYTDADIVNFLTNVECLEGRFDSMGALVSWLDSSLTTVSFTASLRSAVAERAICMSGRAWISTTT